jgi:hypothetical protein
MIYYQPGFERRYKRLSHHDEVRAYVRGNP